jgi:RNA polymerase sigma-70 factor (ECF subfamily)
MQPTKCEAPLSHEELFERLDDPVKRALERVPDVYRVPFLLSLVEDLTCAEIARRLRVPEGTVMSRIHRAREHMKRELVYPRGSKQTVAPRRAAPAARRSAAAA